MKKHLFFFLFLQSIFTFSQTDFSDKWEDFFSYNNVKNFTNVNGVVYAITDNAVFIYDSSSNETKKISSVHGFSGEATSAIHYNNINKRVVIGYQTGLLEVLKEDGSIHISADIANFNQAGEKQINHFSEYNNKLYLSTPFAIIVYDVDKLEFGDTYYIGQNSTSVKINQTLIVNNQIYAATENGIYKANLTNPNLIDSKNWERVFIGNFTNIIAFNGNIYASKGNELTKIDGVNIRTEKTYGSTIQSLQSNSQHLTVSLSSEVIVLTTNLQQVYKSTQTANYTFKVNTATTQNNKLYIATQQFGILQTLLLGAQNYKEIHPDGPLSNSVFAVSALNKNVWLVYGGYDASSYVPFSNLKGYSHYNGSEWKNNAFNQSFPVLDLVHVTIDPSHQNKVFISSFAQNYSGNILSGGGLLEVTDDNVTQFYNSSNSDLEDLFANDPSKFTTRIAGSVFDSQGNLWISDAIASKQLKKLTPTGTWKSIDLRSLQTNKADETNEVTIDRTNNVWLGTRRNGAYVYNENGDRKRALNTEPTKGSLPHANVRAIAADRNNRIWIGTQNGLVVFNNASGLFDATIYDAAPVIILDDGIPKKLLGDQTINAIAIDGADNKWFGTDNGGVLYTNPNGQKTLARFNKDNSPLPSNKIMKIAVDTSTGKVYIATDKGVVAYDSKVASFGDTLEEVYAYPNPALKNHQTITIDGKNGKHLPKGTNVKIVDVAGNLVYETNVVEGQQLQGGKVVWDKRNLAGKKVASGIYIVLLTTEDASEKTTTKIAIIN
ncbi:MAG: T9SS type A sorting domain-containing protein [Flavobacteriaceae bacterium]|nr:T9SS type A sorting domain-containing protein [Flavobacteriaceae bacterium]